MWGLTRSTRVYLRSGATDLRLGFDGLAAIVQGQLGKDLLSGGLFVFCNRTRTRVKVLTFDGSGLWLCIKRLCHRSLENRPVVVTSKPATLRSAVSRYREVGMQGWNGKAERAGPVGAKRRRARRREVQRSGRFPALGGGGRGVGVERVTHFRRASWWRGRPRRP